MNKKRDVKEDCIVEKKDRKESQKTGPEIQRNRSTKARRLYDPFKGLHLAMKAMQQFDDPFKGLHLAMKAMRIVDVDINNILSRSVPSSNFEEIVQDVLSKINSVEKDSDTEKVVINITNQYVQVIEDAPKSVLSLEFFIMLLITLSLYLHSMNSSKEFEERFSEQLNTFEDTIIEKIDELSVEEEKNNNEVYFVVDRTVNMRSSPTTKKDNVITILYPNQLTRLIDKKGKWRKVEYFNYRTQSHEVGWCYKKYLKRSEK